MDKLEKNIVLNALIHDLGKFYMRTHSEEECYGSVSGKKLTHEELLDRVKREASLEVERLDPVYEDFCRVADWIVAQEREDLEDDKDRRKIDIRKEPLISIFSIFTDRESERVKPGKLELSLPSKYSIEDTHKDENIFEPNLYKDFINDLKKILQNKNTDFELLIRCMLDLYRKHLSKIPSASYYSKPTIDLYNHSKLTAAIAISLYRYYKNDRTSFENLKSVLGKIFATIKENTNKEIAPEYLGDKYYTQKFLLLVNGDLSGIQDFIATIHTSDARKMLKARSFYITFLPRIFSLKILKELDLPETNLLFCSGGNFQIICDNTEETKKKIIQTFDELNRELFRNFGSRLFFALKYLELSAKSFREFNNEMENNNWNLIFDKHRKFEFLLREGNIELEAGRDECVICKKEIYVDSPEKICKSCNTLRKLDDFIKDLERKNKMEFVDVLPFAAKDVKKIFYNTNIEVNNLKEFPYEIIATGLPLDERGNLLSIDDICIDSTDKKEERDKENKTFIKMGAARFDLDNLGDIIKGKKLTQSKNIPLSLYSTLSFNIAFYFEGIVNTIWQEKYKNKVIIVYSGGDDGFVIGEYKSVLNFIKDIYNQFKIYVNHNENFNISAAYRVFDIKYPIRRVFEVLNSDLEKAKASRKEKNVISINGKVIRWDYFEGFENDIFIGKEIELDLNKKDFEYLISIVNYVIELYKSGRLSTALLHKMLYLSKVTLEEIEKNMYKSKKIIPNVYMFYYFLNRNINEKDEQKKKEIVDNLFNTWNKMLSIFIKESSVEESVYKLRSFNIGLELAIMFARGEENE